MFARAVRTAPRLAARLPRVTTRSMGAAAPVVKVEHTAAFINNEWVTSGEKFLTENPATGETLAEVTDCTQKEVDMAVEAATNAFNGGAYSQMGGYERGQLLYKLADAMEANMEEFAMLEVLDNGKTIGEATGADLALTIQCLRYYAGWADKIHGQVVNPSGPFAKGMFGLVQQEPVGVVGQIIPWNFPLLMLAWKIGPAIATGCTTVVKPAPQTPLTALKVAGLMKDLGWPEGAVNMLPGTDVTGKLLANHDGLDKLAFTGSTSVGRKIMHQAADSRKLGRVTLELGGKSPMIIYDDCDMDAAVATAQVGLFLNQGQCCCATSRIFVQDSVYDQFVEQATELAKARQVGVGWDAGSQQGSQVSKEQVDNIMKYIDHGKNEGAELMFGGNRWGDKGHFLEPTVFAGVTDDMIIAKEEIFGPVMSILKFSDAEEVITRANSSEYGLGASVFTKDFNKARMTADKLRSGTVWVNTYGTFDAALPFGGFKASGIGRELGEAGLKSYLEPKTVVYA